MGFSISWIAVASKPREKILEAMNLTDSGRAAHPGGCEFAGALLPNGSYLVVLNEFWHSAIQPAVMETLSKDCLVVGCAEEESVNASLAFLYRDGRQIWRVSHVLDEGDNHLDMEGAAPYATAALLAQAKKAHAEQGHDAAFDIPATLAHQVCGFRHSAHNDLRFTQLVAREGSAQSPASASEAGILNSLLSRLGNALQARGFVQTDAKRDLEGFAKFVKTAAEDEITCYVRYAGSVSWCDLLFCIRNNYVQSFAKVTGSRGQETARLWLSEIAQTNTDFESAAEVAAFAAQVEAKLPSLIRRFHRIKDLDALVNGGHPRDGEADDLPPAYFDLDTGFSRIVLAYLAANPAFERMVQTEQEAEGGRGSEVIKLAAHLREHVKPLA